MKNRQLGLLAFLVVVVGPLALRFAGSTQKGSDRMMRHPVETTFLTPEELPGIPKTSLQGPAPAAEPVTEPKRTEESDTERRTVHIRVTHGRSQVPFPSARVHVIRRVLLESIEDVPVPPDPQALLAQLCHLTLVCDGNGETELEEVNEEFLLLIRPSDLQPSYRMIVPGMAQVTLQVHEADGITGTVIDEATDAPVPLAQVFSYRFANSEQATAPSAALRTLLGCCDVSDASGEFALNQLGNEHYRIECHAEGYPPLKLQILRASGQHLTLRMAGSHCVQGLVRDIDGNPVVAADLRCLISETLPSTEVGQAYSDERGEFYLKDVPGGALSVGVTSDGYGSDRSYLHLDEGESAFIEFVLEPAAELSGIVVNDRGDPIDQAEMRIVDTDQSIFIGTYSTEADGRFDMPWVRAGKRLLIQANKDGHVWTEVTGIRAPASDVILTLRRVGSLHGHLEDESGNPILRASIVTVPDCGGPDWEHYFRETQPTPWLDSPGGEFVVEGIWPGTGEVRIEAPGFQPLTLPCDIPCGAACNLGVIRLRSGPRIHGTVLDPEGNPASLVEVSLTERFSDGRAIRGNTILRAHTDGAGGFALAGIPDAPFDLCIHSRVFGTRVFPDLDARDFPLVLNFETPGTIRGQVISTYRNPASTLALHVLLPETRIGFHNVEVDAAGHFEVSPVSPGRWSVQLLDRWAITMTPSWPVLIEWVEVSPGAAVEVELIAGGSKTGGINGHIRLDPDWGRILMQLYLLDDPEMPVGNCRVEVDGFFAFRSLLPGRYLLRPQAMLPGRYLAGEAEVDVPAGDAARVQLDLGPGGSRGQVFSDSMEPLPSATVARVNAQTGVTLGTQRVDHEGRFVIAGQDRDAHLIVVTAPGFAPSLGPETESEQEHYLEPEARLSVLVTDHLGRPVREAAVTLDQTSLPVSLRRSNRKTGADGVVLFTRLVDGSSDLVARKAGFTPMEGVRVELRSGGRHEQHLTLVPFGHLDVSIDVLCERCLLAREVVLTSASGDSVASTEFDSNRACSFENLIPGGYLVSLGTSQSTGAQVMPGERTQIALATSCKGHSGD